MYFKLSDNAENICFYTLRELCRDITGLDQETVVDYLDFYNWMSTPGEI
jgi:hypothetical protein